MEYIELLIRSANGYRHSFYDRTVELADTYKKLYTGEDMDSLMRQFNRRESDDMFIQRKDITQHITSTVMRNLAKPQYKVPRSNNIQRIIAYKDDNENARAIELENILKTFWGTKSVDKYMSTRWIELNNIDPNSFIILEWKDFDSNLTNASPYPFERTSVNVLDYYYDNEILDYVVVRSYLITDEYEVIERYTVYNKDYAILMTETLDTDLIDLATDEIQIINGIEIIKLEKEEKTFIIDRPLPYNLNQTPAFRVGYTRDLWTDGLTMLSPLDDAVPILMKMVKANSELDLTMALHAFPQKIQYQNKCKAEGCHSGYLPDGTKCSLCGGTGLDIATTTQDVIWLPLPKEGEDAMKLDNIIRYVYPPVDLVKNQQNYIERLTAYCKEAIYNTELFSRSEIAETATGKNIDLQNVYDALYSMAEAYADNWEFIVSMIAEITDKDDGLVYSFKFSKDFKMKSLNDLYNDLKLISDSKADSFVKDEIQDDIARIMYHDNPEEYYRWKTKKAFYPFSGMSIQEITLALTLPYTPDEVKALYLNYGWILDVIAIDQAKKRKDFWRMPYSIQYEIIMEKIKEITPEQVEPLLNE